MRVRKSWPVNLRFASRSKPGAASFQANCFYEWQQISRKEKQPFAIGMEDGRSFAFAGLWDRWKAPNGAVVESFTISTVTPNDLMRPVHNRMPCILRRENYHRWLGLEEVSGPPLDLLQPYPAEMMRAWRVGNALGNVRNDNATLIKEMSTDAASENRETRLLWEQN